MGELSDRAISPKGEKRKGLYCFWKWFIVILSVFTLVFTIVFERNLTMEAADTGRVKSITVKAGKNDVTKGSYSLNKGKSKLFKVSISPENARKSVSFCSNKNSVVTVTKKGKITAKKEGTAKITVTVTGKDNKKKSAWVNVNVTEQGKRISAKHILIAYFSQEKIVSKGADAVTYATPEIGNTASAAREIQKQAGGDLFAITTEQEYPVSHSECSEIAEEEMKSDARPELTSHVKNMDQYDVVFVGFPIWLAYHNLIQCTQA